MFVCKPKKKHTIKKNKLTFDINNEYTKFIRMRLTTTLIAFLIGFLFSFNSWASHIIGGEIYYDSLGNNQYKITIEIYRDCNSATGFDNPLNYTIFLADGSIFMTRYIAAYANEIAAFIAAVNGGAETPTTTHDGMMALALAEAGGAAPVPIRPEGGWSRAALAEWIEARGGNPFMEIAVPDASLRLVQACGRLLRTEADRGTITLLDRRVVTQRYGKAILNALPPFRRQID